MSQDNILLIDIVESSDETSDIDIESFDVEEVKVENKVNFEMSNEIIAIDSSDSELDIESVEEEKETCE